MKRFGDSLYASGVEFTGMKGFGVCSPQLPNSIADSCCEFWFGDDIVCRRYWFFGDAGIRCLFRSCRTLGVRLGLVRGLGVVERPGSSFTKRSRGLPWIADGLWAFDTELSLRPLVS